MVLATVAIDSRDIYKLEELGVKDSKLLSPEKREELYHKIKKIASHVEVAIVDPAEIDMRRGVGTNLNRIEAMKIAEMLVKINPDEAYIDSPHPQDAQKFENIIRSSTIQPINAAIYCEHKADSRYAVCSAASIIAKVERDRAVEKIKKEIGFDFGSGYIADEVTKSFIEKNPHAADKFMRKSWVPFRELKKKEEQKNLFDF